VEEIEYSSNHRSICGDIDWKSCYAALFRRSTQKLRAIREIDVIDIDKLLGIERQKTALLQNTANFLNGKPANHALLWGSRGCGKSSLVKAVFNKYREQNLRIIEISLDDLAALPDIIDAIRDEQYYFIIYLDDLSFEPNDNRYKYLKTTMEGTIEAPAKNVLLYATSNRRHLIPEYQSENSYAKVYEKEIHYGEGVEDKISLADRFGLSLSFYQGGFDEYLSIIDLLFKDIDVVREELHREAKMFAQERASRSGRCAEQFFRYYNTKRDFDAS